SSIKRLSVRIIPDNSTRESELRKGSADLAINADFDPVTVEGLQKAEGIKVEVMDGTNITHLGVNLQDPILKDRRIRRALAYAIDREAIIRDVLRGQARPANSVLPPSQWAYEPGVVNYKYDPEMAKKLLGEAGKIARDGQPRIKLSLKTSPLSISRKIGEALQEQMRRVGVEIELQPLERQKLTQDMSDGNFQLYLNILVGGNQSADIFKYVYSSRSIPPNGQNRSRYDNPQLDKLLDEAQMASKDRSREIFSQAQKILSEDLPQIYLWYPATIVVHRDRVSNVKMDPSGDWRVVRSMTAGDRL
ncbi:MAG: ABC transporter substrate-binding protein, partial [Acidobacteria bacterium]|nr:ABC transporter substrate-binding protein [Acidobacteriota bacterium]